MQIKDELIAEMRNELGRLNCERQEPKTILHNTKKDLVRLYAERDSTRGEKERVESERAKEETWWLYICSFTPDKSKEFTRRKRQRERAWSDMIGKLRTKEMAIDSKLKEVESINGRIQSISKREKNIKERIERIEKMSGNPWLLNLISRAESKSRQGAHWDRTATHPFFTGESWYHSRFNT